MKKAMEVTEPLLGTISALLRQAPGAARVATDECRVRSSLKMMEMELSAILAWLRRHIRIDEEWLEDLREKAAYVRYSLDAYERPPPPHAVAVVLHKAARCCFRAHCTDLELGFQFSAGFLTGLAQRTLLVGDHADDTAASTSSRTYGELPSLLKLLSLYMVSMFPQGYIFDKHRLTSRWVSEGLTSRWDLKAEKYFSELVDREVITRPANYGEKPSAEMGCHWQVNPDMLQFLATESANKDIVCTSGMLNSAAPTGDNATTDGLRWLSLQQHDPKLPTLLETKDLSQTRSLAVSGAVKGIPLDKFIYLRVLDLEGWENLKDEDLPLICSKMLLLSYLGVRNTGVTRLPPEIKELHILNVLDVSRTSIRELPSEIKELHILNALDVSHTHIWKLPSEVRNLKWLNSLDLRSTQIRQLPEQIAVCAYLNDLLIGGDGINPDEVAAKIPEGMWHARKLRKLATADLSECSESFVEALGGLGYLEVLAITWSFHQSTDGRYQNALRSSFGKWKHLRSLTIHCGLGCSMEFLGSQLSHPPRELQTFKVTTGRFFVVPKWIQKLRNLSFLQITVCKLGKDDLKILRESPKLQCLVLGLDFLPEEAIVIPSEWFSRLRTFSVDCAVPWLTFREGAMPELRYLDLEICSGPPNEERIPTGINKLGKLSEVVLRYSKWCKDSSSVKMTVEAVKRRLSSIATGSTSSSMASSNMLFRQRQLMRRQ